MKCPKCGSSSISRSKQADHIKGLMYCSECRHYWIEAEQSEIERLREENSAFQSRIAKLDAALKAIDSLTTPSNLVGIQAIAWAQALSCAAAIARAAR
jgi:Zn-finger nucleic acid-binding protein